MTRKELVSFLLSFSRSLYSFISFFSDIHLLSITKELFFCLFYLVCLCWSYQSVGSPERDFLKKDDRESRHLNSIYIQIILHLTDERGNEMCN